MPWRRIAAFVSAVLACGAGEAFAAPLACGDTITVDTRLEADLINCPGDGLVIGADDVTLDLNGHLIDGDGVRGGPGRGDVGIRSEGHPSVTIRRGPPRNSTLACSSRGTD